MTDVGDGADWYRQVYFSGTGCLLLHPRPKFSTEMKRKTATDDGEGANYRVMHRSPRPVMNSQSGGRNGLSRRSEVVVRKTLFLFALPMTFCDVLFIYY